MAFTHVQTKFQAPTGATRSTAVMSISETFASTPTVGNVVFVFISHFNAAADKLTTVTDNQGGGNTWTILSARPRNALGQVAVAIAYSILTQASGTFTVTANFSANSDPVIGISEFSGNRASSIEDGSNSGTGASTAPQGGSVTPSGSGDLFLSAICDSDSTQTYTIPTGWDGKRAENADGLTGMTLGSASFITPDAAAHDSLWTIQTSSNWAALTAAFKPAAVAPIGFSRARGPKMIGPDSPASRFRSTAAFVQGPPQAPPGSASFWRGEQLPPTKAFGKGGPWSRIAARPTYFIPTTSGDATALAAPGTANFTSGAGKAIGEALVGAAAGSASFTSGAGRAVVSVTVGAAPGTANFSSGAGKATGAATRGAAAGTATFASPSGKGTGAALTTATASTATFSSAPGHASAPTAATVGAAPGLGTFSSAPGKAGRPSGRGHAGFVVVHRPWKERPSEWNEFGRVSTVAPAAPGMMLASSAAGRAIGSVAATVRASPGIARLYSRERRKAHVVAAAGIAKADSPVGRAVGYHGPDWSEIAAAVAALVLLDDPDDLAKSVQPLDRDRPIVNMMRVQLRHLAAAFLRDLGHRVAAAARNVGKAAGDDPPRGAAAEADAADYEAFGDAAKERIREVAKDGAHRGLEQVRANVERLLAQTNKRAVAWADRRAGELVTSVSQTTRDRVRELVRQAEEEGWSNDELADAIAEDGVFGDARAETIARTETADADVAGNLEGWKESGVVSGKEWTVAQDSVCDICEEFDGMIVGLDEEFPEGDPPAHPNCRCDVLPVLADESDEE